jgi:hypothetical protein
VHTNLRKETFMLRKMILVLATGAALGAAALAPSTASAFGGHWGHWGGGHWGHWGGGYWGHGYWRPWGGYGFYRPGFRVYAGPVVYGGCVVRRWVYTPWGPRVRWVNRCY